MAVPVGGDGFGVVPSQEIEVGNPCEAFAELLDPLRRVRGKVRIVGVETRGPGGGDCEVVLGARNGS